jgi:uncharacterized protein (DUF1330 family)
MPAYVIADVTVTDPATMEEYRKQVPATIAKYGGRYLVRGGAHQTLEGEWKPSRLVILEFPSMADARRWYDCEEYRGPKALRMKAGRTNVVMVEGAGAQPYAVGQVVDDAEVLDLGRPADRLGVDLAGVAPESAPRWRRGRRPPRRAGRRSGSPPRPRPGGAPAFRRRAGGTRRAPTPRR